MDDTTVETATLEAEEAAAREAFTTQHGEAESQFNEEQGAQSSDTRATDKTGKDEVTTSEDGNEKTRSSDSSAENDEAGQSDKKQGRDKTGKFTKAEDDANAQDSKYSKSKKEQARQKSLLDGFEQKKAEFRKEQENLARERAEFQRQRQESSQRREQTNDTTSKLPQLPSSEYRKAADILEKQAERALSEGDSQTAQEKLSLAREARQAAHDFATKEHQGQQQEAQRQHNTAWENTVAQVIHEQPEYADSNSDLAKEMHALIQENPVLTLVPDGFRKAHDILMLRRDAAEASALRDKVKTLETKLKEHEDRTRLTSPSPAQRRDSADFDGMSDEEQDAFLREQTRARGHVT